MVLRKLMGLFVCTLILGVASFAMAGVPDMGNSEGSMPNYAGLDPVMLFNLPGGTGSTFANAQLPDGSTVDATIEVVLRDGNNDIIPDFPAEDLWLASADDGMVACIGGAAADADTDEFGVTDWSTALAAGGSSLANTHIMVSGDALTGVGSEFALHFNSADMDGSGSVLLNDVGAFSTVFYGAYAFTADFFFDGVVNLSDVGRLAQGVGSACP